MIDRSLSRQRLLSDETAGFVLGFFGVLTFGASLPATSLALEAYDPWFITFARAAIATIASIIVLVVRRRLLLRAHTGTLFLAGIMLCFAFPGLMAVALEQVPASHGGIVLGILPLATAVFAAILGGERPSMLFWACGIAGTVLVVVFALRDSGTGLIAGDVWLLLAGISASLGYVLSGKLTRFMTGWEVICWALVLCSPVTLAGTILTFDPSYLAAPVGPLAALLYLGLFSMFLGFFFWNIGLALGGIAKVGQIQLLQPFITLGLAVMLLGETVSLEMLLFALAVVAVVAIGRKARVSKT